MCGPDTHTPHTPARMEAPALEAGALGRWASAAQTAQPAMIELTRGRPHQRDGLARARICGGRLPRCRATAVLPPSGMQPKCGSTNGDAAPVLRPGRMTGAASPYVVGGSRPCGGFDTLSRAPRVCVEYLFFEAPGSSHWSTLASSQSP